MLRRNIVRCLNDDTPLVESFRRSHVDAVVVARIAEELAREGLPKFGLGRNRRK
jgi:hypothetical protein